MQYRQAPLPKKGIPLKRLLQNLAREREFPVRTLMPNFTFVALKMWVYSPKNRQNWYFWFKFAQKWYTLSDFLQIFGVEEAVPGLYPHAKFHRCGFKNVVLQPQNREKMVIFGTDLPLRENYGDPQKSWI